jgi:hypothetical protein
MEAAERRWKDKAWGIRIHVSGGRKANAMATKASECENEADPDWPVKRLDPPTFFRYFPSKQRRPNFLIFDLKFKQTSNQ